METIKTVSLFGATGLVGGEILSLLIEDNSVEKVLVANRREVKSPHPKVTQIVVDFDNLSNHPELFQSDCVFICLGTTIKKAGSKEAFEKVDFEIPKEIASLSGKGKVKRLVAISSLGADANSSTFYLKTKGKAEDAIFENGPDTSIVVRPSLLIGDRDEFRLSEKIAQIIMPKLNFLFVGSLKKYRSIKASQVAISMLAIAKMDQPKRIYDSEELKELIR